MDHTKSAAGARTPNLRALGAALLLSAAAACSSPEQKVEKYTKSGEKFFADNDFGRANVQFQNALKINEEHVPALLGIARIAESKQDFQTMFGVLQSVVRIEPDNIDAQVDLGKLYLIGGDEKAALEIADKSLELAPENLEAMSLKSAVQLKLGDKAGAVELARKVMAADPGNAEAAAVLATERAMEKDPAGALAVVDGALKVKEDQAVLHLMRLQILSSLGRKDELRAAHEKLIALYPDNIGYRQIFAKTLIAEENLPQARAQLEEVVKRSPGEVDPVLDVVRVAFRIGGAEDARKTFQKYVEAYPGNFDIKFNFASFLSQQKDFAGAEALLNALEKAGDDKAVSRRARNEIAGIRLLQGKKDEARTLLDAVLEEDAKDADALMRRASLRIDDGLIDEAIADLRAVVAEKPESAPAKILLATAFEKKGDLEYATSQMAQAVLDSGHEPKTTAMFAKLLIRNGDIPRAEKSLLDSIAKFPQDLANLKLLAAVRLMQQNWRGAEETAKLIENVSGDDLAVNSILGAAYTGLKDYAGAVDTLNAAGAKAPLAAQPLAMLVGAYIKDGRAIEAESMLRAMIDKDGTNYAARLLMAQTLQALKRPDDVETELKAAIAAAPDRGEAVEALYRLMRSNGRNDEAGALVAAAASGAPDNDGFKVLQADYFIATARPAQAIALYADVLSRRPGDLLAANNFASLTLETAADAAAKAKALEVARPLEKSDNPFFLDTFGWAQYHNADYAGAVATLEKAVAGAPNFAEARYHLGAALIAKGDVERGRAELEQAIASGGSASFVGRAKELSARN